ncbi:fumarylacetoacetase [Vallicoccus soli]|uniref:fumarylacetoacetase n=1 Tax=Vallicoccus soli TaxID=2339232 RepID=A0A3A3ZJW4_9ACTN|nr:fumarylacetoacetase [Vallicoccus soli]RJK95969.1 fumarylacetoacetase [Vallicoccus soli]
MADPYGVHNLPYGSFSTGGGAPRLGVRYGDAVLDVAAALPPSGARAEALRSLDALLAAGPAVWREVRAALQDLLTGSAVPAEHLHPLEGVRLHLPFTVADYVDFYASEQHASNVGRILRPGQDPLPAAWRHLPIGYHGRSGTVVVSGTDVVRPCGQRREDDGTVAFGPTRRLDLEAELGFVVGVPTALGEPVPLERFAEHVLGVCLVDDWSARDVQAFEYVPLGPFLGKSFATSVSPWVVPLAALEHARVPPPPRDPRPLPHLDDAGTGPWGLDVRLEVLVQGTVVSRPPAAGLYWTGAQQLAHLTSGGASLRTGDLYASGTVSGPAREERGSLLELSWGGTEPVALADGTTRTYLEDGDEVVVRGTAPGPGDRVVGLGEVRGRVLPARGQPT